LSLPRIDGNMGQHCCQSETSDAFHSPVVFAILSAFSSSVLPSPRLICPGIQAGVRRLEQFSKRDAKNTELPASYDLNTAATDEVPAWLNGSKDLQQHRGKRGEFE